MFVVGYSEPGVVAQACNSIAWVVEVDLSESKSKTTRAVTHRNLLKKKGGGIQFPRILNTRVVFP